MRPKDASQEWFFGVHVDPEDQEQILGYWVSYDGTIQNGEEVPEAEMLHVKINVDQIIRRGLSDLFASNEVLTGTQKLLRAGVQGESVRQAIAYIREHALANEATIRSLRDANSDYTLPVATGYGPTKYQPTQIVIPGSVSDVPEGLTFKQGPVGNAANAVDMLGAAYQQLAVYFQVPQWMASGDTGNTNFSASLTAESPFVRDCQKEQKFYGHHFRKLLYKVLEIAEDQGKIPEGLCEQLDIQVEYPPVAVRNAKEETDRNKILHDAGQLSPRTWSKREELDFENEQENIENDPPVLPPVTIGPNKVTDSLDNPNAQGEQDPAKKEYAKQVNRPE